MNLKVLSNFELEDTLRAKAGDERQLALDIIALLEEVDRRKLHLERGYGSLLDYCVKELKYSEASAYRRISAMRVVRDVPETKADLAAGTLNLVTIAKAQAFFNSEAKNKKIYSRTEKGALLNHLKNKSTREAEKTLLAISPDVLAKEKVKVVAVDKTLVTLLIDDELMLKLNRLKSFFSHKTSGGGYAETINAIADLALEKLDPERRVERDALRSVESKASALSQRKATPALEFAAGSEPNLEAETKIANPETKSKSVLKTSPSSTLKTSTSRYIPAAIKREVWRKSRGECAYQNKETGVKCTSKHFLEIDHIHPRSSGGENHIHNLQLLCDAHNRWKGTKQMP